MNAARILSLLRTRRRGMQWATTPEELFARWKGSTQSARSLTATPRSGPIVDGSVKQDPGVRQPSVTELEAEIARRYGAAPPC
jgi:hypothetical protein